MSDDVAGGRDAVAVHPVERRNRIVERVASEQTIKVAELAQELHVSEMTIRRDIRRLERDGFLRQTYGGATAHVTRSFDVSFNARGLEHPREKRIIGIRGVELIGDASLAYLGIGTTVEQLARYLPPRADLSVVTASLPIASLLGTRALRVIVLGGNVLRDELHCVGPAALRALERFRFDLAIVGAAGLSATWGITELTDDEAEVQRRAIERSRRLIVLADGSKIGAVTSSVVAPAERIEVLVTDASAPARELEAIAALGVEVVVARGGPGRDNRPRRRQAGAGRTQPATTTLATTEPRAATKTAARRSRTAPAVQR
ncbi:MAG: DeoR/GlpR family DNA-binding transcription regulator [Chloroflexota bacterium]